MSGAADEQVHVGRLDGAWGVRGWVRVFSYTDPPEAIFDYQPWQVAGHDTPLSVIEWRRAGPRLVARLEAIPDRAAAELAVKRDIHVPRSALPPAGEGEYYWRDLEGLKVLNRAGLALGSVRGLVRTAAHDVLIVAADGPEILIPFVPGHYIDQVSLEQGFIRVDWDPDWSD